MLGNASRLRWLHDGGVEPGRRLVGQGRRSDGAEVAGVKGVPVWNGRRLPRGLTGGGAPGADPVDYSTDSPTAGHGAAGLPGTRDHRTAPRRPGQRRSRSTTEVQ